MEEADKAKNNIVPPYMSHIHTKHFITAHSHPNVGNRVCEWGEKQVSLLLITNTRYDNSLMNELTS